MDASHDLIVEVKESKVNVVYDKFRGMIWGCALAAQYTTYAFDHMSLLLDSAYFDENNIMRINNKLFASKLVLWRYNNKDSAERNIDIFLERLIRNHKFTIQPHIASIEVYKEFGGNINIQNIKAHANSNALMRIAPLALSEEYLTEVAEHCMTTNFDSRCIASCLFYCDIVRHLLKNPDINENDINKYYLSALSFLNGNFAAEFTKHYNAGMTAELLPNLDTIFAKLGYGYNPDEKPGAYTFESITDMLWALRSAQNGSSYNDILSAIARFDDDIVGIIGTIVGLYYGYSRLHVNSKNDVDKKINDFFTRT